MWDNDAAIAQALAALAKATADNTWLLTKLVDKIDGIGKSTERISEEELREQRPLEKVEKFYIQKLVPIRGQETWENIAQEFAQHKAAEDYGMEHYWMNKFRILNKVFYYSKLPTDVSTLNPASASREVAST